MNVHLYFLNMAGVASAVAKVTWISRESCCLSGRTGLGWLPLPQGDRKNGQLMC